MRNETNEEARMTRHEIAVNTAMDEFKSLMALDYQGSKDHAFAKCGCQVAFPTWWMREDGTTEQVDCSHLGCRIRRGEFKRPEWLVRLNAEFRSELSNWLRFSLGTAKGRRAVARLYWAMRKQRKFDIMSCVWAGVAP
jgi:hypothetical protein